jgi:hypothetical protein
MNNLGISEGPSGLIYAGRAWPHDGSQAGRAAALAKAEAYAEEKATLLRASLGREPTAREMNSDLDSELRLSDASQRGREAALRSLEKPAGPLDWIDDRINEIRGDYSLNAAQREERIAQLTEHKATKQQEISAQERRAAIDGDSSTRYMRTQSQTCAVLAKGLGDDVMDLAAELEGFSREGSPVRAAWDEKFNVVHELINQRMSERALAKSERIAAAKSEFDRAYQDMANAQAALATVDSSAPDVTG